MLTGTGVPVDISDLQLKPSPPDYVTNEDGTLQPLRDVSEWSDESPISPAAPSANDERYSPTIINPDPENIVSTL